MVSIPVKTTVKRIAGRFGYSISYDNDYEPAAQEVMAAAAPYTMTTRARLYALWQAARHISYANIPGAVVECGVWKGGSMYAAARTLAETGDTGRDLYLFDTFEGMTEPSEQDIDVLGRRAADLMEEDQSSDAVIWAHAPLEPVKRLMNRSGYPADRVQYVIGDVRETLPAAAPERVALLRLDTDWYDSTKHELDSLYDRLSPGGVLLIDDYGYWAGARQAVDEFFQERGQFPLLTRIDSGCRIHVKC